MKPRRPLRKMSKKREGEARQYAKCKKVFLREHPNCARCGTWKGFAVRDLHHWAKRAGKLYLEEKLWMMLCRECHDWVHRNEQQAQKDGWLAPRGALNNHSRALVEFARREERLTQQQELKDIQIYLLCQIANAK